MKRRFFRLISKYKGKGIKFLPYGTGPENQIKKEEYKERKEKERNNNLWASSCFTGQLLVLQGNTFSDNKDLKCQQTKVHHFSVIEEKLNLYNSHCSIDNNWKVYL